MKVKKIAWLEVDGGTPREIEQALDESSLPPHAVAKDIAPGPIVSIKFEWVDDE